MDIKKVSTQDLLDEVDRRVAKGEISVNVSLDSEDDSVDVFCNNLPFDPDEEYTEEEANEMMMKFLQPYIDRYNEDHKIINDLADKINDKLESIMKQIEEFKK